MQSNWTDPTAEAANQAQEPQPAIQHTADTANQNTGSHYHQGEQQVTQYQTNQQTGELIYVLNCTTQDTFKSIDYIGTLQSFFQSWHQSGLMYYYF